MLSEMTKWFLMVKLPQMNTVHLIAKYMVGSSHLQFHTCTVMTQVVPSILKNIQITVVSPIILNMIKLYVFRNQPIILVMTIL
ncbi:hypothetical protein BMS3Abin08_00384 [bacterium BMS3Abin08]|nr:hypothetical protein BMS3Abin08_00384 [bacterium BMS3Abin08]